MSSNTGSIQQYPGAIQVFFSFCVPYRRPSIRKGASAVPPPHEVARSILDRYVRHALIAPMVFRHFCFTQECASEYQERTADKCLHCCKGVRKAGDFSGSYYPVERTAEDENAEEEGEAKEEKVHLECWEAYQAKLAAEREPKT